MLNYSAGIYDIYDDDGSLLKDIVPIPEDIPDFVKKASAVTQQSNKNLFALVLVDEGKVLKKYATADRGNTWLSTLYFSLTKDLLPEEAQKVAAANLIDACDAYQIAPPDLLWEIADGPVDTNIVDVSGVAPMTKIAVEKEDVEYAIERADGSKFYPLRDAADVATAMKYFDRNEGQFVPRERREFAVKVATEAEKGSLPVSESIQKYAGTEWNPALKGHLTTRYVHLTNAEAPLPVRERLVKMAEVVGSVDPNDFAVELAAFDREHGLDALWDKDVADPWYSTFGMLKVAKGKTVSTKSWTFGNETVTEHDICQLGERGLRTMVAHFGAKVAGAFQKNPVQQFEAMPLPQKRFIARLATSIAADPST